MNKIMLVFSVIGLVMLIGCTEQTIEEPEMNEIVIGEEPTDVGAPIMKEVIIEEDPGNVMTAEKTGISLEELAEHDSSGDCWIVYEGDVYDITNPPKHPSMQKSFFRHCGKESGFEEGAKGRHSGSNEGRVLNYGSIVGELAK